MKMMKKGWFRQGIWSVVVLAAALLVLHFTHPTPQKSSPENSATCLFSSMSTVVSVQLYHPDPRYDFGAAFQAVKEEFRKSSSICNFFDPESELSRLNRTAGTRPFVCSDDLWQLLTASRTYYRKTGGAFDVTVSPLLELWGFYKKRNAVPSPEEIRNAIRKVGMDKIDFNDSGHTVRFRIPGMAVNLGGIAKGWTLDRTLRMLQERFGIRKGFLNAGGNVLAFGGEFTGGIRDPFDSRKICGKVKLSGTKAIATSGAYERFVVIDGKEYGHILDPRTGHPADTLFSATVIADTGLESDALSTSFYLCGMGLQREFPAIPVLLIGRREKDPSHVEVRQSGDCWELNVPDQVPPQRFPESARPPTAAEK